jgi:hypothetical protein
MVAAPIARTRSRSAWPSFNRPCCSRADSKIGIITLSRLPHTRSDASHNAVNASSVVAPYLRRRSRGASTPLGPTGGCCRSARTALAMPARRRAQRVEDPPLLRSFGRPVTLRHRRRDLAPRAHADLSRHRRHRTDSVTPSKSSARSCPVTFWVRQCGGQFWTPIPRLRGSILQAERQLSSLKEGGSATGVLMADKSHYRAVMADHVAYPMPGGGQN